MVRRDAAGVRLLTRNGLDWSARFPLAEFRRKLSRRYSLFDVGMACIRVWMELYEVCMSSIEQADRRAEGERRAAPDGTRKKAGGRLGGRRRLGKPSGLY